MEAPPEVVFKRLEARAVDRHPLDLSDATWEIYLNMVASVEKINKEHYVVNTSENINTVLEKIAKEVKRP